MKMKVTREYLKYLESQGEGKINWDVWDKMVEDFHKWMEEYFSVEKNLPQDKRNRKTVYVYDYNGELVKEWTSNKECADDMKCSTSTVHNYSKSNYVVNNYLLSREELTKDVAFAMYRFAIEHGKVYSSGISRTKPKKAVYRYTNEGKMVGLYESLYQYCKVNSSTDMFCIKKRLTDGDIIVKTYLLSYNFYDEETAKEMYMSVKKEKKRGKKKQFLL